MAHRSCRVSAAHRWRDNVRCRPMARRHCVQLNEFRHVATPPSSSSCLLVLYFVVSHFRPLRFFSSQRPLHRAEPSYKVTVSHSVRHCAFIRRLQRPHRARPPPPPSYFPPLIFPRRRCKSQMKWEENFFSSVGISFFFTGEKIHSFILSSWSRDSDQNKFSFQGEKISISNRRKTFELF